jgi:hypothetical protein
LSIKIALYEYSYCINSPEIYVDLDGEFFTLITGAIGAVAGAVIGGAASAITQVVSGKSWNELDWGDIGKSALTGAAVGGITGLTMGAAAAVLPAAGAAVGIGTSMSLGLSASAATTLTTAATVAGGMAIGSAGLFTASSIVEQGTSCYYNQISGSSGNSYNPIRDSVLGGNQGLYDTVYMASAFTTVGIMQLGASNIGLKPQKPNPNAGGTGSIKVIGKLEDTAVAKDWSDHDVLNDPNWTLKKNDSWVQSGINNRQTFYIASPTIQHNLVSSNPLYPGETVFARELRMLIEANYTRTGDYMIPPSCL